MSNRFDSPEYVNDYLERGAFPRIHDHIFTLTAMKTQVAPAIDLGSCTGLLSVRLVERLHLPLVIGIEASAKLIAKAVTHPQVKYVNMRIERANFPRLAGIIKERGIKLIVARRVFPEIGNSDAAIIPALAQVFDESGIEEIVLEGRVFSSRSLGLMPSSDKECELLGGRYKVMATYKNCRFLQRK